MAQQFRCKRYCSVVGYRQNRQVHSSPGNIKPEHKSNRLQMQARIVAAYVT
jgi:hypothetical protein